MFEIDITTKKKTILNHTPTVTGIRNGPS